MELYTQEYFTWLKHLQDTEGKTYSVSEGEISKIPDGYNSIQRLNTEFIKDKDKLTMRINHTNGHVFIIEHDISWNDFINMDASQSESEKNLLLQSIRILFAPSHVGTVYKGYDELGKVLVDLSD